MIPRRLDTLLRQRLAEVPVVALLGSRQVGKTTLARGCLLDKPTHYLDLERPSDLAKMADPELYLSRFAGHLVILDEVQRLPNLFPVLRSLVDERRRAGERAGQFLLLGSASPDLLQQSAESLAGRISYLELPPLHRTELEPGAAVGELHWLRGGYPDAWLASSEAAASQWCQDFITSYVERDLPQLGVAKSPVQLRRLCTMLAHQQGGLLNLSQLGNALDLDGKTVRYYLHLLEQLYLVRSLPAWSRNSGKRLVKSPPLLLARQRAPPCARGSGQSGASPRPSPVWSLLGGVLPRADPGVRPRWYPCQPLPHPGGGRGGPCARNPRRRGAGHRDQAYPRPQAHPRIP